MLYKISYIITLSSIAILRTLLSTSEIKAQTIQQSKNYLHSTHTTTSNSSTYKSSRKLHITVSANNSHSNLLGQKHKAVLFKKIKKVLTRFGNRSSLYYRMFNDYKQRGICSYYNDSFQGRTTAAGVPHHQTAYTGASRTLPLMSIAKVTNLKNKKSIEVMIVDRGPYVHNRILDISKSAAEALDFIRDGYVAVEVVFNQAETTKLFYNNTYYAKFYERNSQKKLHKSKFTG